MADSQNQSGRDGLISFFILTYTLTWGIGAFIILFPDQVQALFGELTGYNPLTIVAVSAPTIMAAILTWMGRGWPGLKALYASLVRWRVGLQWYVLILAGLPAAGWLAAKVTGSDPQYDVSTIPLAVSTLLYLLVFGPLLEEPGWRGYALPRLLERVNPFIASLVLGIIWGVWHLPSFFVSSLVQSSLSLPVFLLMGLSTSVVLTWIFKHTSGSVLVAILLHYVINLNCSIIGVPLPAMAALMLGWAALVLVLDPKFGWFTSPQSSEGRAGVSQTGLRSQSPLEAK